MGEPSDFVYRPHGTDRKIRLGRALELRQRLEFMLGLRMVGSQFKFGSLPEDVRIAMLHAGIGHLTNQIIELEDSA